MFSLTRTAAKRVSRPLIRSFAEVVTPDAKAEPHSPPAVLAGPSQLHRTRAHRKSTTPPPATPPKPPSNGKVPVRQDHGLYAFFRKRKNNLAGEGGYEVVETPEDAQLLTGRAWEAAELRNKSFKDLHILWYVALREKNLLATQKEEARRMGVSNAALQVSIEKVRHCRKTMARTKAVLNERRLAYEGAVQLARQQSEAEMHKFSAKQYEAEDKEILKFQRAVFRKRCGKRRRRDEDGAEPSLVRFVTREP
ncbi:mitochondrial 39-S ribosomal protein L47 (MRP-L47)-domain-containing protein [Flammula alnicola]|nr:mitochondrial 39-S ribosomal protein L47 (MRP-L47)-domain-containing protein [Flammula alnicola]